MAPSFREALGGMLNRTENAAVEVIKGPYFDDLMAQPEALKATLAWLGDGDKWAAASDLFMNRPPRRIVLTGMGASLHALHPLNLALIQAGFSPVMMETAELVHYGLGLCDAQTLVILVSQSGYSAEALSLLKHRRHARVLGITNTDDSPLALESDLSLITRAGPEFSVSCKTYVTGMLVLQWLGEICAGGSERDTLARLSPAQSLVEQYLRDWRDHVDVLGEKLQDCRHLFLTGRGGSLAAANAGALIIKESSHVHAEGMSSAAFRHGPLEMLRDDMATFVFNGDNRTRDLNQRLVRELSAEHLNCDGIGRDARSGALRIADRDPLLLPILEFLPVEMMTLALAGLSSREAGTFERASKITAIE